MTEISFIIVNYNSLVFIKNLLDSFKLISSDVVSGNTRYKNSEHGLKNSNISQSTDLAANDFNENSDDFFYEIIIFDNGSYDGSIQYIGKEASIHKNIKLVKSAVNEGFCKGSNILSL